MTVQDLSAGGTGSSDPQLSPLASSHTAGFPGLLRRLGASLAISTYQAGKLVVLRADGDNLNTHFRGFNRPMGIAATSGRLAVGTALQILEFHDLPAVAARLDPPGKHDACFLPRRSHTTGDVQIHEMAWGNARQDAGPELWFVNTRFSCLCTRSDVYSFVPRWRPGFITALAPEDRCHLNGLALGGGVPRFVTALGQGDTPGGWRERKRDGGVVLDIASGAVVARGLSMPHSPRWHDGRLWVLDSGSGGVGVIDLGSGGYEPVAVLPGFTRGLDFLGGYAFIGLSEVRESAVFSGIAIAERPVAERWCGVAVLEVASGKVVEFVRFQGGVQEVFAVQALPGLRFPDVINDDPARIADSFVLPDEALASVPAELRFTTERRAGSGVD
jgi:uncharacterized protein (TIGR03032 family)